MHLLLLSEWKMIEVYAVMVQTVRSDFSETEARPSLLEGCDWIGPLTGQTKTL